jgi:hypothetical protein
MARFQALSHERIAELTARRHPAAVDLSEYKSWIEQAAQHANGWGEIELAPEDSQRAIKRRTTIAGKELGKTVKWHRKSNHGRLIFRVLDPQSAQKRTRRKKVAA